MSKSKKKNQEKNQLDLQNAKVPNFGRIRWHRIHKLGGTEFPRISKGWRGIFANFSRQIIPNSN
jgi:hypothetical protein